MDVQKYHKKFVKHWLKIYFRIYTQSAGSKDKLLRKIDMSVEDEVKNKERAEMLLTKLQEILQESKSKFQTKNLSSIAVTCSNRIAIKLKRVSVCEIYAIFILGGRV